MEVKRDDRPTRSRSLKPRRSVNEPSSPPTASDGATKRTLGSPYDVYFSTFYITFAYVKEIGYTFECDWLDITSG